MKHKVVISEDVLFQMITAGLEAYCVKHPNKREVGIECIGQLWGHYTRTSRTSKLLVKSLTIDTSARMNRGWVLDDAESLNLKMKVAELFEDHFTWLGDFHSHPYVESEISNAQLLRQGRNHNFSPADVSRSYQSLPIKDTSLMLSIVMTFYRMQRTNIAKDGRIDDNTFEFSIGNVKCWLHAQIYNVEQKTPEETLVETDFLESFSNICSDFRHTVKA